jgi:hypothetical protein
MFRRVLPTDRIQVTLDVSQCQYKEAQELLLHSNSDPFHLSEIVDRRHDDLIRTGRGRLDWRVDAF